MSRAKRQHYVPQFLLKNFAGENGKVEVFDKKTCSFRYQSTGEIAHESGFYLYTLDGNRVDGEEITKVVDNFGAVEFDKIVRAKTLGIPVLQSREDISMFIAFQALRVPSAVDRMRDTFEQIDALLDTIPDCDDKRKLQNEIRCVDSHQESLKFLFFECERLSAFLMDKLWALSETVESEDFWISDNPISFTRHDKSRAGAGFGTPFTEVALPVSPTLRLRLISRDFLYALTKDPVWCRAIGRGIPVPSPSYNVHHQRVVQLANASRFVYAKQFDRKLVVDLFNEYC
ncbi:MAG: DUF4238 domain-containing protein [Phycisphaerales bacterium]